MEKIMVVDDVSDFRDLIDYFFGERGYKVSKAQNGHQFLDKFDKKDPDIVLLDINMPELNGWETLRAMRRREIDYKIPVIMLTVEKLDIKKILLKEIDYLADYVEKPFEKNDLLERVEKTLEWFQMVNGIRRKIEHNLKGEEYMGKAFLEWSRTERIHNRVLRKLKEYRNNNSEDEDLKMVQELIDGEKGLIDEARRKKQDILRNAGLDEYILEERNTS